jgi:hypothetical protein
LPRWVRVDPSHPVNLRSSRLDPPDPWGHAVPAHPLVRSDRDCPRDRQGLDLLALFRLWHPLGRAIPWVQSDLLRQTACRPGLSVLWCRWDRGCHWRPLDL